MRAVGEGKSLEIELEKVAVLELEPTDILVVSFQGKLSPAAQQQVHDRCKMHLGITNKVLILEEGTTIMKLKATIEEPQV
jgi:hypothetical protein